MRNLVFQFVITVLMASAAFGQELQERVFRFTHVRAANEVQEVVMLIRAIGEIRQVSANVEQPSMTIRGTAAQVALAEWLMTELDSAPNRSPVSREYRMPGGTDDIVRVFYLTDTNSVQELQEAATMIRAIVEIRRMFTYNAPRAMVVRGTAEQIKLAEWMLPDLNRPANSSGPAREYRMLNETSEGVVRVFHLKPEVTIRDLQEVATLVRSMSDIRRLFTYNASRAIAVRGTVEQIQLAQWLVGQLDKPAEESGAPGEFRMLDGEVVRVFHVTKAGTPESLQEIAVEVRQTTAVRRLFTYNAPKAMAIRGTAEQIATADQMIKERNQ